MEVVKKKRGKRGIGGPNSTGVYGQTHEKDMVTENLQGKGGTMHDKDTLGQPIF